jgi:hypothetical protein
MFNILKDKQDLQNQKPPVKRAGPCIGCDGPARPGSVHKDHDN